jgi:hypothetical protein
MVSHLSGLAFELATADVPDVCSKVANPCFAFKNQKLWSVIIVNYDTSGAAPPAVIPGTYTMNWNTPPTTPTGTVTKIGYDMTDASCDSTAGGSSYNPSGSVTINTITATNITGSYDILVFDGQHLTGTFDVAVCGDLNSFDICGVNSGHFTGTCPGTSQCI